MGLEEFGEGLRGFSEEYIVIDDDDDFLIYRKLTNGPKYVGSVSSDDAELYEMEDILKQLGIYE